MLVRLGQEVQAVSRGLERPDSLSFDQLLAASQVGEPQVLRLVLGEEIRAGRIQSAEDGSYRIVPSAFDPETLEALAELRPS
jgi:hypothetical protein